MDRTLKLTICYDGTDYCGWQIQPNGPTIQAALERAFAKVFRERIRVTASGRTDSGVHAIGQVASCTVPSLMDDARILQAINGNLPKDIRVTKVTTAAADFHAIRDAKGKRYQYRLQDGEIPNVLRRRYTWFVRGTLGVEGMRAAAAALVGRHDFASFQAAGSDRKTTIRTIRALDVQRCGHYLNEVVVEIEADGFLYNMVRNIVGSLVEIGMDNQSVGWMEQILQARDRSVAGRTAPPQGLFLLWAEY